MPPARDTSVKQTAIETGTETVTVQEIGEEVVVRWTCGGARAFTKEALREHLKNFALVAAQGDVYYTGKDKTGGLFYALLVGNQIKIADTLFTEADSVPFVKFRTAVNRHTKPPAKSRAKKAAKPRAKKT